MLSRKTMLRHCAAMLCAAAALLPVPSESFAAPKNDAVSISQSGKLPSGGRVALRSGLEWMDETAPVFQKFAANFGRELTARGLTMVSVKPSALSPMPKTPMPTSRIGMDAPKTKRTPAPASGVSDAEATQKASELGQSGKLPPLKLRNYGAPAKDKDLPDSVKAITPPDVGRALFATSQQRGAPAVTSFAIPGRVPKELKTDDAKVADYVIVVRFASVRAWAKAPEAPLFGPGVLVAAASVSGSGRLGYGPPASPSAQGGSTYGTPGGYVRGYEGSSPSDPWGRDGDFYQRDYMFKHGEQPQYATPPSGLSDPRALPSGGGRTMPGRGHGVSAAGWYLLVMEAYDLAPIWRGKEPEQVWKAEIRRPDDGIGVDKALDQMIRAVFADPQ